MTAHHILTKISLLGLLSVPCGPAVAEDTLVWNDTISKAVTEEIEKKTYKTVTSVLIQRKGQTLYENYFNGANKDTLHDTRSATKTLVALAMGAAIEQKLIKNTNVKVSAYFPNYSHLFNGNPKKTNIKIQDLLTMSSALECDDWNQFSRGNEERMYLVEDWSEFFWSLPVRGYPGWQKPPSQQPFGRAFSYCSAGVQILGEAIQTASNMPFKDFIRENIFDPLEISDYEWQVKGTGQVHMIGGLRLTSAGLAKLGELQRRQGTIDGNRIFSEAWSDASFVPRAQITNPNTGDTMNYGYLWWLYPFEVDGKKYTAAAMNGNGGNRVWVLPEFDLTIVLTKTDFNTRSMHAEAKLFFDQEILPRLKRN
ncbi:MAG: serine hydrolase [Kordiimonadales bacterium]|nr:MAG: serine hydrolase [Kordiimonadales bacterium]